MTPDRFSKMVEKAVGNYDGKQRMGITNVGAAVLLRREHAAVVRLVKQRSKEPQFVHPEDEHGYRMACADILAALAARRKGERR